MPVLFQRLWIQLTADRKRFGILCGALGLAMLLWARVIVVSNVPRTAVADDQNNDAAAATARLQGAMNLPDFRRESQAKERQAVALDRLPERDPFVISTRHFPRPASDAQTSGNRDKSALKPAEDSEQAMARQLAALRELAGRFKIEAVMQAGSDSADESGAMAVINGRPWRIGQAIPAIGNEEISFVLVQVRHRSVVLSFEEHLFELTMDRQSR